MWILTNKPSLRYIIKVIVLFIKAFNINCIFKLLLFLVDSYSAHMCSIKQWQKSVNFYDHEDSHSILNLNGQTNATFHFDTMGYNENIYLEFRTRDQNQMMFSFELTNMWKPQMKKTVDFYMQGFLLNGTLVVKLSNHFTLTSSYLNNVDTKRFIYCISDYDTCADTKWHRLLLMIKQNDLLLTIDNQFPVKFTFPIQGGSLSVKSMHLGINLLNTSQQAIMQIFPVPMNQTNFRGCFRSLTYKSEELFIPLLATEQRKDIHVELPDQSLMQNCDSKLLQPRSDKVHAKSHSFVSFIKPGGYLRINGWKVVLHGEITFTLRTTTLNGLIMYSNSIDEHKLFQKDITRPILLRNVKGLKQIGFDIFALELRLGRLHFLLNTGSGLIQPEFNKKHIESESKGFVSDGREHAIQIIFDEGDLTLNVDGENFLTHGVQVKTYKYLNLNEYFYIGGLPEPMRQINSFISPDVWSAQLRHDFLGCLSDLTVNKELWDIDLERRTCWSKSFIESECTVSSTIDLCTDNPCENGGLCHSRWNTFHCDCSYTDFIGKTCTENPIIVAFNGFQWIWIKLYPLPIQSAVEELTLRFKTKYMHGFLLTTRSSSLSAPDCLELKIISGYLLLIYNLGAKDNVYHNPVYVADNNWHTVKIYRRENFLNVTVDYLSQTFDIPKDGRYLSHHQLIFGSSEDSLTNRLTDTSSQFDHTYKITNLNTHVFIGYLMVFLFNGVDFLQTVQNLKHDPNLYTWRDKLDITADQSDFVPVLEMPVTFKDSDSYINIQLDHPADEFILEMRIKLKKYGSVLHLYNDVDQNFILELVDSGFRFIRVYNGQAEKHQVGEEQKLTEAEWYYIKIIQRPLTQELLILINDQPTYIRLDNSGYFTLRSINIGGLSAEKSTYAAYSDYLQATTGFQGCLTSFLLNHSMTYSQSMTSKMMNNTLISKYRLTYLYSNDTVKVKCHNILKGCQYSLSRHSELNQCSQNSCHFNGICLQQWNSITCDCSLTGFTGKYCEKSGTSIYLSESPTRYAIVELNSPQNTTLDRLAFGMQIIHPGSLSLLHIQGQGQSADYMQVSLLHNKDQQNLLIRYNMGGGTQTLYQPNVNLNDAHFHIIQFIRHEAKGLLRIDFQHEISKTAEDQNNKHFNSLKRIYIGQLPDLKRKLLQNVSDKLISAKGFEGYITGLNFNGINLIDVVTENMIPGIYLKTRQNIEINPNFKPNIKKLKVYQKSIMEPESTSQNEANDMQLTATDFHDKMMDYKTQPIIVPKTNCLTSDRVYNYKDCQPADLDGIIRPFITFNDNNALSMRAADKNEPQRGWNADQSINSKQSETNDLHSVQSYTKFDQSNVNTEEMEPFIKSWFNPSTTGSGSSSRLSQEHEESTDGQHEAFYRKNQVAFDKTTYENSNILIRSVMERNRKFPFNIVLIIAVSISGICVLVVLTCIIYRCMRRDEGTYNVEESIAYTGETLQSSSIISSRMNTHRESPIPLISLQPEFVKSLTLLTDTSQTCNVDGRTLVKLNLTNEKLILTSNENESNPDLIMIDKNINDTTVTSNESSNTNNDVNTSGATRKTHLKTEKKKSPVNPKEWYV
ncbi:unnamed protein product [Heterobilharzia americana]|nr:unnamed protein product [Heterobilharzia americana]